MGAAERVEPKWIRMKVQHAHIIEAFRQKLAVSEVDAVVLFIFIGSRTFTLSDARQRVQTRGLLCSGHSLGMDFQIEGLHDFQDGVESRISFPGEGFV